MSLEAATDAVLAIAMGAAAGVAKADVLGAAMVLSDEVDEEDALLDEELLNEELLDKEELLPAVVLVALVLVALDVLDELVVPALLVVDAILVAVLLLPLLVVAVTVSESALPVVTSVSGPLTCWQWKARSPGVGGVTSTANLLGPEKPAGMVKASTP